MLSCAVALVLLLDISASVSDAEWVKQRDGTAEAFVHPIIQATVTNMQGGMAVKAIAFGGRTRTLVPWRVVRSPRDLHLFAKDLSETKQNSEVATEIGRALDTATKAFDTAPCDSAHKVIDISTDGVASKVPTEEARDRAVEAGIVVNAIGVGPHEETESFLRESVISPTGFAIMAESWDMFALAIRRKITWEIASAQKP